MITISFTASAMNFSPPPPVVEAVLRGLPAVARYVTGACEGGDAWTGAWLHANRPLAEHVVIVPADRSQVDYWWEQPENLGDPDITIIKMPWGTSYSDRNAELVARADWVTGFPPFPEEDPRSAKSGTWETIRMARDAGKLALWQAVTPPYAREIVHLPPGEEGQEAPWQ